MNNLESLEDLSLVELKCYLLIWKKKRQEETLHHLSFKFPWISLWLYGFFPPCLLRVCDPEGNVETCLLFIFDF